MNEIGRAEHASGPLMASAPDLYSALEAALTPLAGSARYLDDVGTDEAMLHAGMARAAAERGLAALRKARGET